MTARGDRARSFSGVLYDIAQLLASANGSDDRLRRALALLQRVVPFDRCGLLEVQGAHPGRVFVEPEAARDEAAGLRAHLERLLELLAGKSPDERAQALRAGSRAAEATLAVPLVARGEIIGMLLVRRGTQAYSVRHLRALAIVGGQIAAYLAMVRAQEALQTQAVALDEARRVAEAANRAKDEFLAVMSHELKDPVTSTLAWTHILSEGKADAGPGLAVAAIERNARLLAKLIDDIQRLSCVARAELRLDLRAIEPARVLRAAIEGMGPRGEPKAPRLDAVGDSSPTWLEVEPERLGPIVSSVVATATEISSSGDQVGVLLDRAHRSSEPGPRAPGHGPSNRGELDGISVLFVDDDVDIREAFQWVLESHGAIVTAVPSARAALTAFERSRPDVLLCDLGMPGENGYDLMRRVAVRDPALPAAALTAFGELAEPRRAIDAGFRIQLAKPIDAASLVAAILDLLQRQPASSAVLEETSNA